MNLAPVQRGLERDDAIPVASVYPASGNGTLYVPRALMNFRVSSSPFRFDGRKGPWKVTGLEDAGPTGSPSTLQNRLRNRRQGKIAAPSAVFHPRAGFSLSAESRRSGGR